MRPKWVAMILLTGVVCLLVAPALTVAASEKEEVNRFYKSAVEIMKQQAHVKELVALVEKNPRIAERCLTVCGQKSEIPGQQGEALGLVHEGLRGAILLASKSPRCEDDAVRDALTLIEPENSQDDQILWLERLASLCPKAGAAYIRLGDLYLKQARCGMAVAAYRKAVELTGDEDSKKLLKVAQAREDAFSNQKTLSDEQVRDFVRQPETLMGIAGIGRKVEVKNKIQQKILFDEWSYQIKPEFLPELKMLGQSLKETLSANPHFQFHIEGHTDKRGPFDRNMQLSKDRAEAIKKFLVQNFGIGDSSIVTAGHGPTRPYSPEDNEKGWSINRRVEWSKSQTD